MTTVEAGIGAPSEVRYRWVKVVPVPPIEKPPCPLWNVQILHPEWLDGGRTWLSSVDYSDFTLACASAVKVDAAFEVLWRAKLAMQDANRAVYTAASDVSSTNQAGVSYQADRAKLATEGGEDTDA